MNIQELNTSSSIFNKLPFFQIIISFTSLRIFSESDAICPAPTYPVTFRCRFPDTAPPVTYNYQWMTIYAQPQDKVKETKYMYFCEVFKRHYLNSHRYIYRQALKWYLSVFSACKQTRYLYLFSLYNYLTRSIFETIYQTHWKLFHRWSPWWRTRHQPETRTPRCAGQKRTRPKLSADVPIPKQWWGCVFWHTQCPTVNRIVHSKEQCNLKA